MTKKTPKTKTKTLITIFTLAFHQFGLPISSYQPRQVFSGHTSFFIHAKYRTPSNLILSRFFLVVMALATIRVVCHTTGAFWAHGISGYYHYYQNCNREVYIWIFKDLGALHCLSADLVIPYFILYGLVYAWFDILITNTYGKSWEFSMYLYQVPRRAQSDILFCIRPQNLRCQSMPLNQRLCPIVPLGELCKHPFGRIQTPRLDPF